MIADQVDDAVSEFGSHGDPSWIPASPTHQWTDEAIRARANERANDPRNAHKADAVRRAMGQITGVKP